MPLYEYICSHCRHGHEAIQKSDEPPLTICPSCNKEGLRRTFAPTALHFKGEGFYITDYANKSKGCGKDSCGCKGD